MSSLLDIIDFHKLTEIKETITEGSIDLDHFNDATIDLILDPCNILILEKHQIRFVNFVAYMDTPAASVHHLATTSFQRIQYQKIEFSHSLHLPLPPLHVPADLFIPTNHVII